jgi:O-antigen/teichoic acid export membrane protein/glycosyltransferase involved in cell wall biosynthesis
MSHWPISILSTLSSLVSMFLPLILVRILGPDSIGLFKIFFLYLTIFPAFSMVTGLLSGLPYWTGRKDGIAAIRMSSVLLLLSAAITPLLIWAFRVRFGAFFNWPMATVAIFCVGLFVANASQFYEEVAIARGYVWSGALFSSGLDLARTTAIVIVALITRDLTAIFATYAAAYGVKALLGYILSSRQGWVGIDWDSKLFVAVWKYALPVSFACALGVLMSFSDQMILSKYISAANFAFYSIGCLTVPPLIILEVSVSRVLIPQLAVAFTEGDLARAAALYRKAVREMAYLSIPAVTGMIVFAHPIIQMLFTDRYASSASYLRIYALFYLVQIIFYDSVARARGESKWILSNFIKFALFTAALCWGLTAQFGPWGALAGLLLSKFSMKAYAIYYMKKTTPWKFGDFLPFPELVRYSTVCLGLAVLSLAMKPLFGAPLVWFFVSGAIFSVLYFVLTVAWGHAVDRKSITEHKVLLLAPYVEIGGLERMVLNLASALKESGTWHPEVFAFDHPADSRPEGNLLSAFAERGIPVEAHCKGPGFSVRTIIKIARHALDRRIHVIHSHDLGALIYAVGAKIATFNRVRLVHTQHSFVHLARKRRYRFYERLFTLFVDELAVVSEDTRATYAELGLKAEKIHFIPNGVAFTERPGLDRSEKCLRREVMLSSANPELRAHLTDQWLLCMARIHGRKGQEHALAVWNALAPEIRQASILLFVGPVTDPAQNLKLRGLIETAQDRHRIFLVGPALKPHEWLEASDLFISGSEFEGMPLGPIEAAGAGLPLVISRIPGHEALLPMSRQFDFTNSAEGARLVTEALAMTPESANSLQTGAQATRLRFSLVVMSEQYMRLYTHRSVFSLSRMTTAGRTALELRL